MAFWNVNTEEPLRQFRWYISFPGNAQGAGTAAVDFKKYQYALKKSDRPKMKINSVQHKFLNHFYNYPGRVEWEDIQVTFAAVDGSGKDFMGLLKNMGYHYPEESDVYQQASPSPLRTISKKNATEVLGTVEISNISTDGVPLETFKLKNAFFTNIAFGSLDYSSEEIVEISCTIKYDSASVT